MRPTLREGDRLTLAMSMQRSRSGWVLGTSGTLRLPRLPGQQLIEPGDLLGGNSSEERGSQLCGFMPLSLTVSIRSTRNGCCTPTALCEGEAPVLSADSHTPRTPIRSQHCTACAAGLARHHYLFVPGEGVRERPALGCVSLFAFHRHFRESGTHRDLLVLQPEMQWVERL